VNRLEQKTLESEHVGAEGVRTEGVRGKTGEGGQRKKYFEQRALKELKLGRRALE